MPIPSRLFGPQPKSTWPSGIEVAVTVEISGEESTVGLITALLVDCVMSLVTVIIAGNFVCAG